MKPMLPNLTFDIPIGDEWVYETKYDGFRAIITIDDTIKMISRNGKDLLPQFPEASEFFLANKEKFKDFIPLILDGELSRLVNPFKSDFSTVQTRGRLRADKKIQDAVQTSRCTFMAFDILQLQGKNQMRRPFKERKQLLLEFYKKLGFPIEPTPSSTIFFQYVPYATSFNSIWTKIKTNEGEGIIAKQINSQWEEGKRSGVWKKYKNWKRVKCFITAFEKGNGYFHIAVFENSQIKPIGIFKNGMTKEETAALVSIIRKNSINENGDFIYVDPSICVEVNYLELFEDGLREPYFSKFLFEKVPTECTWQQFRQDDQNFPIEITHPDKPLWQKHPITKLDYLSYMRNIYPYISPFLENRNLTVIRYPHGTFGEAFFQKNCPEYAPDFVDTHIEEGINYIVCNNLETYLWLGNQLAIEFHIPYRTIGKTQPSEIVIDLDPPTRKEFNWAVEAALYIKEDIIDKLGIHGFIKVSGNRGIQIYFPLPEDQPLTWDETRLFTEFVAKFLLAKNENHFTIERLKKNRNNRLYIDYVQHAEGKTIICPFSLRGNENAGVAAPIFWEELKDNLRPDGFSMNEVMERMSSKGNPFKDFFEVKNQQPFKDIIQFLKK